jgi:hypothetical protein
MPDPTVSREPFEQIYSLDLVFEPDCWRLCGDAHCCSFARHKARFRLLKGDGKPAQELPLLPGEFEFLEAQGWSAQFHEFERRTLVYDFGPGRVLYDTVTSARPGCACDHDTRTAVCRLYPLLPVFAADGRIVATEPLGVYEELELLDGLEPACRLSSLPFPQLNLYLELANAIGASPVLRFHLMAYRLAKRHLADRIGAAREETGRSAFSLFETAFLRRRLFDHDALKGELVSLWDEFLALSGPSFAEAMEGLPKAGEPS